MDRLAFYSNWPQLPAVNWQSTNSSSKTTALFVSGSFVSVCVCVEGGAQREQEQWAFCVCVCVLLAVQGQLKGARNHRSVVVMAANESCKSALFWLKSATANFCQPMNDCCARVSAFVAHKFALTRARTQNACCCCENDNNNNNNKRDNNCNCNCSSLKCVQSSASYTRPMLARSPVRAHKTNKPSFAPSCAAAAATAASTHTKQPVDSSSKSTLRAPFVLASCVARLL